MVCRNDPRNHACLCDLIESLLNRPTYVRWFAGRGVSPGKLEATLQNCSNCHGHNAQESGQIRLSDKAERLFAAIDRRGPGEGN